MLRNDIENIKERINRLENKMGEITGGTTYLLLKELKKVSSFNKIEKFIEKNKKDNDLFLIGIKAAVQYAENAIEYRKLASDILKEGKKSRISSIKTISCLFYKPINKKFKENQEYLIKSIQDYIDELENRLDFNKPGLNNLLEKACRYVMNKQ